MSVGKLHPVPTRSLKLHVQNVHDDMSMRDLPPVTSHTQLLLWVQDAQDDVSVRESHSEHEEDAQEDAGPDDLKKVLHVYMLYLVALCLPISALRLM